MIKDKCEIVNLHSILIILEQSPNEHNRVLHDSPLVVSQEIAIVVVQSFVCRPHFVHFQTFMAVKLALSHIRQNTGYDFFCIGDVSIYLRR